QRHNSPSLMTRTHVLPTPHKALNRVRVTTHNHLIIRLNRHVIRPIQRRLNNHTILTRNTRLRRRPRIKPIHANKRHRLTPRLNLIPMSVLASALIRDPLNNLSHPISHSFRGETYESENGEVDGIRSIVNAPVLSPEGTSNANSCSVTHKAPG